MQVYWCLRDWPYSSTHFVYQDRWKNEDPEYLYLYCQSALKWELDFMLKKYLLTKLEQIFPFFFDISFFYFLFVNVAGLCPNSNYSLSSRVKFNHQFIWVLKFQMWKMYPRYSALAGSHNEMKIVSASRLVQKEQSCNYLPISDNSIWQQLVSILHSLDWTVMCVSHMALWMMDGVISDTVRGWNKTLCNHLSNWSFSNVTFNRGVVLKLVSQPPLG